MGSSSTGEGDIFLAERSRDGGRGEPLVDVYLFGDSRESYATAAERERRAAAC